MKSRIWEMKGGKYAKTLAKIQVRGIFRIRDIRRNVLPRYIEVCMHGDAMLVPIRMNTNMADRNQQKHLLPTIVVLLQKREFILRRTRKH